MRLKKGTFSDLAKRVKASNKKIILYGAGLIGQVSAPYWLHRYHLDAEVLCYVDADVHKQGQTIQVSQHKVFIVPPAALEKYAGTYILLVTASAFTPVVHLIEQIAGTEDTEVYFMPIMLLDIAHTPTGKGTIQTSCEQLIPKTIHYCWFSGKPIPDELKRCMDSWKKFCPDYEIVRWDESNYDMTWNPYMQQAYTQKKWGFVPDVARLDILYRYGGIYLDTDVELVRNLDELLYQPAFCGTENWGTVNFGGGSGAQARNPIVKAILDNRKDIYFLHEDGRQNLTTCGYYETVPLIKLGMQVNGETQSISDGMMNVYSPEFFHPFDYMSGETKITENTFSIHHFNGTWLGDRAAEERLNTRIKYREFLLQLSD